MRKILLGVLLLAAYINADAKFIDLEKPLLTGMYIQWGYNMEAFTNSDLHFKNGSHYNFTVENARAKDKPDFSGFVTSPTEISIPQYSYRLGFYLNKKHTHAIEINFDHTKYVVRDYQRVDIHGQINGQPIDWKDTLMTPAFLHMEHTNGGNFFHLNYVRQQELIRDKKRDYSRLGYVWKIGAGVVVPKSDIKLMGVHLDNKFHVAGVIVSGEAGLRFHATRNLFFELTAKAGYANYFDVLAVGDGGKIKHHFYYVEGIGLLGYELNYWKYRHRRKTTVTAEQLEHIIY